MLNRLYLATLLMLSSATAFSQTADASLTGTVLDPSGAAVGGARVTIRNQANGATRTTVTNNAGVYLVPALPPATYELTVEHPGFQKYVYGSLVLDVGAEQSVNVTLTVGATTESVEVRAGASDIQTVTSSIGNVITGKKLEELPLVGRSVYDLINTTAGVAGVYDPTTRGITTQNFNGTRSGALNITLLGSNIQDAFFDGLAATAATSIVNVDRIAEYKIVTSPADAEYGRGSGQIIMVSRSGTNRFHGSLFEEFRNTVLTANSWFNNFNGVPRDFLAKNQFGGRFGGPILKDRLFFNFHYEGQRQRQHNSANSAVYTQTARQGLYRFFPGVITANALAANPTVDLAGNPVMPRGATGPLQSASVFGLDPVRNAPDPSGNMQKIIGLQPLPNNYRIGDGLNVAGYQWNPVLQNDYDESDFRIDYAVLTNHRFSFGYSDQNSAGTNPVAVAPYPSVPNGLNATNVKTFNVGFTSVLRPNLINEFRGAALRPRIRTIAPYEIDPGILAHKGDQSLIVGIYLGGVAQPFAEGNYGGEATNRMTPVYQYGDTVTWLKGRHAFKGGAEYRFISDAGYDLYNVAERADVFTSANAPRSTNFDALPGIAPNAGSAAELASELAGSISAIYSTANSPGGKNPAFVPNLSRYRHWKQNEFDWFFKDDWKVTPNLTLNLGLRYEWYQAPYEANGLGVGWVGGGNAIFSISGRDLGAMFKPGLMNGSLAQFQPIGPGSPNPNTKLWNNDNNNFGPAIGLSWSLPWWGKDKTVLRAGYQIGYERNGIFLVNSQIFGSSGYSTSSYIVLPTPQSFSNVTAPIQPPGAPLSTVPITDRSVPAYAFDSNLRTPYIQNWNFTIERVIAKDTVLDIRYVGNKSDKLVRSVNVNEANIFENGILDAYNTTLAGGNAQLFDKLFNGLSTGGRTVNGTTFTGSDYVRTNPTYQAYLANNNIGAMAWFLNTTQANCGYNGCLLARAGLPANFIAVDPQFTTAYYTSNFGNAEYNAMEVEVKKRYSAGFTFQGNYTLSKAIGDAEGNDAAYRGFSRTERNRHLDRRILSFDRTHVARLNGIWELPFGKGQHFARNSHGLFQYLIGGWQIGGFSTLQSGAPINLTTGGVNPYNFQMAEGATVDIGVNTPNAAGNVANSLGGVTKTGKGVVYFNGFQQVKDPSIANMPANIAAQSPLFAIADASGKLLFVNGTPGQFPTLPQNFLRGPGLVRLDANLLKRLPIAEGKELVLRADAFNLTNTPEFIPPDTNINSTTFGRITNTIANSSRVVVLSLRFSF